MVQASRLGQHVRPREDRNLMDHGGHKKEHRHCSQYRWGKERDVGVRAGGNLSMGHSPHYAGATLRTSAHARMNAQAFRVSTATACAKRVTRDSGANSTVGCRDEPFQLDAQDMDRLKKTSVDYVLCDEADAPLVGVDFDGMNDGFNAGARTVPAAKRTGGAATSRR
jgi:hypothetical protein